MAKMDLGLWLKNQMKPYLSGVSDGYLRVMTCKARKINKLFGYEYDPVTLKKIKDQVKSKTTTSPVNEISEPVANASANDPADDNFSNASEDDFEKTIREAFEEHDATIEKERQNKMSSNVVTPTKEKAHIDYDDVYFEEDGESNEVKSDPDSGNDDSNSDSNSDSDSDDEYDHELHERLQREEMARLAKLEESVPCTFSTAGGCSGSGYENTDHKAPPEIALLSRGRARNDEFHNLGRNRERFWGSIASKINQENGSSFNGHQCKEKFSNLVRDYNTMCDFMAGSRKARRSRTGAQYFDEFRTHFWERPEDEFDRVRSINTLNRRRTRGSGNITPPAPSTREVERELRSSERRLSRSPSISRSQSPSVSRTASRPSNNDNMVISDTEHESRQPPSYDVVTAMENFYDVDTAMGNLNVEGNTQ